MRPRLDLFWFLGKDHAVFVKVNFAEVRTYGTVILAVFAVRADPRWFCVVEDQLCYSYTGVKFNRNSANV